MERQPVRIEAVVYRANIDGVLSTVVVDDDEGDEHMIVGFIIVLQMAKRYCVPVQFLRSCRSLFYVGKQMATLFSTNTCEMFYVLLGTYTIKNTCT